MIAILFFSSKRTRSYDKNIFLVYLLIYMRSFMYMHDLRLFL